MDARLKNLEPRVVRLLMVSAATVLAVALFTYVIWPQVKAYRSATNDRTTLERVAEKGEALEPKVASMQHEVETIGHQLHGDMVDLPDKQLEAFVIGRLQGISWRNNVELRGVKPGKGAVVQIFREVLFDVEVSGDYFDLFAWLQELRKELGFVVVKQFFMRPLERDKDNPRLSVKLTIVSYRRV
jgi:hypothetical protein